MRLGFLAFAVGLCSARLNKDYCKLYEKRSVDFLWIHEDTSIYCCKDCCFISQTKKDSCTKDYCLKTCPSDGSDKGQCILKEYKDSKGQVTSYVSEGCE